MQLRYTSQRCLTGAGTLKTADFNKDGRQDLALAAGANVFVLLNTLNAIQVVPLANGNFDADLDNWTTEIAPLAAVNSKVEVIGGGNTYAENVVLDKSVEVYGSGAPLPRSAEWQ